MSRKQWIPFDPKKPRNKTDHTVAMKAKERGWIGPKGEKLPHREAFMAAVHKKIGL